MTDHDTSDGRSGFDGRGGFEEQVAAGLRLLVPDDTPRTHLADAVPVAARRRRTRRRVAVAALAAAAVAVVAGGIRLDRGAGPQVPATPPPAVVDTAGAFLEVQPGAARTGSHTPVALFVVNPTDTEFGVYGASGTIDRWTGTRWTRDGAFDLGLDFWGTVGRTYGAHEDFAVAAIGLSAPARATGGLAWLDVSRLRPGWYRLGQGAPSQAVAAADDAGSAFGLLHVTDGAPALTSAKSGGALWLTMAPMLPPAAAATVPFSASIATGDAGTVDRLIGRGPYSAMVEQLGPDGWSQVGGTLPARRTKEQFGFEADLPALAEGTYRLVLQGAPVGELRAPFWVLPRRP